MPSDPQQTILDAFMQAAGHSAGGTGLNNISTGLEPAGNEELNDALTQATQVINAQTQATSANTDALGQDTQTRSSSSGVTEASSVIGSASELLGGGLSLLPLASLFSSLFGGGQSEQPAPLVPYSMPPSLNLESTTNYENVSWGENGLPRAAGSGTSSAPSQITVQVQAMDSQSFLDHSDDIAQAVRQAMLNMSSLNDVVANL
jgi:hypothetical protein